MTKRNNRLILAATTLLTVSFTLAGEVPAQSQKSAQAAAIHDKNLQYIMASYTQGTWKRYISLQHQIKSPRDVTSGQPTSAAEPVPIPDPDCPPLPVQECRDSWKILTINPFPD